ncbi:MAG: hypothetical protein IJP31_08455 [Lachnospiraceae bacterium]|nr:hypothetical protein [Lachnospiraceae bacterium]
MNKYMCSKAFEVSWYYVDEACLEEVKKLKEDERGEYYLSVLVEVLKRIARLNGRVYGNNKGQY